jgi:hypothetical protein
MEVREYLRRPKVEDKKRVEKSTTHIVFKGERFDVMSVRRWRERLLKEGRQ